MGEITIELPAGYNSSGVYRHYSKIVRLVNETDVARFGGVVDNIDADACDDASVYEPLAVWGW